MTEGGIVQDAVAALAAFRVEDREIAAQLLPMWVRYPELTEAQRRQVLKHYPEKKPTA